jgi:hypothetical protein
MRTLSSLAKVQFASEKRRLRFVLTVVSRRWSFFLMAEFNAYFTLKPDARAPASFFRVSKAALPVFLTLRSY